MNLMSTLVIFSEERAVFLREHAEKLYSIPPYFTSKLLIEIPITIVATLVFTFIVYFGIGV